MLSSSLWPAIGGVLTLILGLFTWSVSRRQNQLSAQLGVIEATNKHREELDRALASVTDNSQAVDRRMSGIWKLAGFWSSKDDESVIGNTLAAELLLPGDGNRFARCAAAEAIGDGIKSPASYRGGADEQCSERIARRLYGASDGTLGVVTVANVFLSRLPQGPDEMDEMAEHCATRLAASKEAIRKNWEYLGNTNLNVTDLSQTQMYSADMAGAVLSGARPEKSNFRCANLFGTTSTDTRYSGTDFRMANVQDMEPVTAQK